MREFVVARMRCIQRTDRQRGDESRFSGTGGCEVSAAEYVYMVIGLQHAYTKVPLTHAASPQ